MAKIGVDLDQVLADFSAAFDEFHDVRYGTNLRGMVQTSFYLHDFLDISKEEELRRVEEFFKTGYFTNLKPFPDSIDAINALATTNELVVITARPDFIQEQTKQWVLRYYPGCFQEVVLTSHYFDGTKTKSQVCQEKNVEIMIEDMVAYANDCASVCQTVFLIERPWNKDQEILPNVRRVSNWSEIVRDLI